MSELRIDLLHECFNRSAKQFPDAIAVDVPPTRTRPVRVQYSYAQLDQAANNIAGALQSRGIALEEIVLVLLGREDPLLYAAQLGIMKSGGAYCALDPRFPDAHIHSVMADCEGARTLTDAAGVARLTALGANSSQLLEVSGIAGTPAPRTFDPPRDPSRLAYVIYTSGTTGRPKGVLLEHRGIVNLVESDRAEFGLGLGDRIAQCSSPAYDSSIEETYLALAVGATLVPLDDETVRLGPDLVAVLREERVRAFCPPPTLLRALGCVDPARELPDLGLLYVGGEALPQDLADLYAPHSRLENGYGPTECSVTVTRGTMQRGKPVTIGRAVINNRALVMREQDGQLVAVPVGERGELCIEGVGLARGYRGDAALTAAKFPTVDRIGRIYRTGDLASMRADGTIEFFGRIDAQVKLRGYRVELGAVEAELRAQAGVQDAAATIQSRGVEQRLVAFIVPCDPLRPPDIESIRASLRLLIPSYMVPSEFAVMEKLPTSIGGKLDRKNLPKLWPDGASEFVPIDFRDPPADSVEQAICSAFGTSTGKPCGRCAHFFHDLDGDSLSAVAAVLLLRRARHDDPRVDFARFAVRDLYASPTPAALAACARATPDVAVSPRIRRPLASRGNANLASTIRVLILLLGVMLTAGGAFLLGVWIESNGTLAMGGTPWLFVASLCVLIAPPLWLCVTLGLAVLAKKVLLGEVKQHAIGYWTWQGTKLWITASLSRLIPWNLVHGTTLEGWAMRCLGASIGERVHFARGVDLPHGAFDLLEIGDGACFAQDSALRAIALEDGHFLTGPIRVGAHARVGVRAALEPNSTIESHGHLSALSLLEEGQVVPAARSWTGVPARDIGATTIEPDADSSRAISSGLHATLTLLGRLWSVTILVNLLLIAATLFASDELAAMEVDTPDGLLTALVLVSGTAACSVPLRVMGTALLCRALPRVREGVHPRYSMTSLIAAAKARMLDEACAWLSGSLYWPAWLRMAGAQIGPGCEISTIMGTIPEMIRIGPESFFADGIYLAAAEHTSHTFEVRPTSIGARTFIGNHAVLAQGVAWSDDLFIGVSTAPDPAHAVAGSGWLGVPAMRLPRREVAAAPREDTHDPSLIRWVNRLLWETLRVLIPVVPAVVGVLAYAAVLHARDLGATWMTVAFLVLPASLFASALLLGTLLLLMKWAVLGRVQPGQHAFWSCWCSRWDFLYVVWGYWGRSALSVLQGTLLLNQFLRLAGARIGKRTVLGPGFTQLVDPDMLTFGDDATVACQFQAHSFEDRVLKIDRLRVGARATVGEQTVVFYGVDIGNHAIVRPNGIVMKREKLAPDGDYCGAPVAPR